MAFIDQGTNQRIDNQYVVNLNGKQVRLIYILDKTNASAKIYIPGGTLGIIDQEVATTDAGNNWILSDVGAYKNLIADTINQSGNKNWSNNQVANNFASQLTLTLNKSRAEDLNALYPDGKQSAFKNTPGYGSNPAAASPTTEPATSAPTSPDSTSQLDTLLAPLKAFGIDIKSIEAIIGAFTLPTPVELSARFGKVDEVIKRISPLQYPIDALYDKTQDHLVVTQFQFKPPFSDSLFGSGQSFGGGQSYKNILTEGLQAKSPLQDFLGIVRLPIPNNISDSNNVAWGEDNMNNLSAALASYTGKNILPTLTGAGALSALGNVAGASGLSPLAALAIVLKQMNISPDDLKGGSASTLLGSVGTSRALAMLGVQVSPEAILSRGYGIVPNSNLELLFNAPTLREFQFQYRLSPRSSPEADTVNKILRFFKQGMAAKKLNSKDGAGAQSYFLGTPNVFKLQYKTSKTSLIKGLNRIKTCALTGFSVNYAPDGSWAAYDEGQPVSVIMNMSFKELEPVYDTDYQTDIDPSRKTNENQVQDLYPVEDNEVGY